MAYKKRKFVELLGFYYLFFNKFTFGTYIIYKLYYVYKYLVEDSFSNLLKYMIDEGDIVIDIGANIGYYTKIFSKIVGVNGKVIALEPNINFQKTLLNINNIKNNIVLLQLAAGSENKKIDYFIHSRHLGGHKCYYVAGNSDLYLKTTVNARTLSAIFKQEEIYDKKITLIKIDVEGFEYQVLKGLEAWIVNTKYMPKIIFEVSPYELGQASTSIQYLQKWFDHYSYKLFLLNRIRPSQIESLAKYFDGKNTKSYYDIYCRVRLLRDSQ